MINSVLVRLMVSLFIKSLEFIQSRSLLTKNSQNSTLRIMHVVWQIVDIN